MITRLRKWLELSDKVSLSDGSYLPAQLENNTFGKEESASTQIDAPLATLATECDVASAEQEQLSSEHQTLQEQQTTATAITITTTTSEETSEPHSCSASSVSPVPDSDSYPDFPLLPASRGFCLSLKKHLELFQSVLETLEKKVQ